MEHEGSREESGRGSMPSKRNAVIQTSKSPGVLECDGLDGNPSAFLVLEDSASCCAVEIQAESECIIRKDESAVPCRTNMIYESEVCVVVR